MKKVLSLVIITLITGSFLSVNAAFFSDDFANNLLNCTQYTENLNSVNGYDKNGKCIMQASNYTCNLSKTQVKEISRAILIYNKKSEAEFSPNAYKKLMMVFNRYVNNSKVCKPRYNTYTYEK